MQSSADFCDLADCNFINYITFEMTTLLKSVRKCKGSGIIVTVLNDYDITVTNISKQRIRCNNTAVPVFIENTSLSKDDTVGRYAKNCFVLLKLKQTGEWRLGCSVFISGWFDMSLFLVWNMACPIVDLLLPDRVHTNYILNFMDVLPIENKCYELHFLNRASTGVFGHYMKDDIVNKSDGGLQMSVKGPDHFLSKIALSLSRICLNYSISSLKQRMV